MWRDLKSSCIAGGNVNGVATMKNSLVVPQKAKQRITTWPSNSPPRHIPQRIENRDTTPTCMPMFIAAYSRKPKGGNNPSAHWQMSVVYAYNDHKK